MREPAVAAVTFLLLLNSLLPGAHSASSKPVTGQTPAPPTPPVGSIGPRGEESAVSGDVVSSPPSPGDLPLQMEEQRARQAIEATLHKGLDYWGPRYQVGALEVTLEGEWAYGVAEWQGEDKPMDGSIQLLARRNESGAWQALLPSEEGMYLEWVEQVPERLVPADEKSKLRKQVVERDAPFISRVTRVIPQAPTPMPVGRDGSGEALVEPTELLTETISSVSWAVEGERSVIYTITDGGIQRRLADVAFESMSLPQFDVFISLSPSRRYVTYVTADDLAMHNSQLWLVDLGSGTRRLVATFSDDLWIAPFVWSPNSRQIAFTKVKTSSATGGTIELWTVNVETGEQTQVVSHSSFRPELFYLAPSPEVRWSADGSSILYTDYVAGSGLKTEYAVDLSSGKVHSSHSPLDFEEQTQFSVLATLPCGVTQFSQNDPEWRDDVMQTCGLTIGAAGCAVTSVAMTFKYYAVETSPRSLNQCLGDSACPIYWGTAASNCSDGKSSYLGSPGFAWSTMESNLSAGRPVIVELNGGDGHYVVAISGSGSGGSGYTVNDPWDGQVKSLAAYTDNGWTPTGLRVYDGTPWCEGSDCTAPTLQEPTDGETEGSRTVTFRWDPPSSCDGLDVYTFRVVDDPDRIDSGPWVKDYGVDAPDTQTTTTFDSEGDYWWAVWPCRGCKTGEPNYGERSEVRHFHIDTSSPPPSCDPSGDQIAMYADPDYGGSCVTLGVGDYPSPGYFGDLGNDNAESIRVGDNVQATLCEHDDYQGRCETFTAHDHNLSDNYIGANVVSSARVESDTQPPSVPALQSPGDGTTFDEGESISLSWSDTGDEYYGEVAGGPGGTLTFGWQSGTSYNLGSQWAGYTYSWRVKARNDAGESGWSKTWAFTVRPAVPADLRGQTVSCSEVNLYWDDNSGNEEGYKVYRDGACVDQVGANATSYQDTGLSESTSYSYYVKAFRGSVESDASNTVNVTTPSCSPPQPDLMPSQWDGWQYPVVPSSITDTTVVNTLYVGYPTYIDWGLTNVGDASTDGDTYGALYIDEVPIGYHDFGDVLPGYTWAFFDWVKTVEIPGWHTLKSVADPDDLIDESDETNNVFERDFYWVAVAPYADDMESGVSGWSANGLWHQVDGNSPYPTSYSGSHSWWYGQDSTGDYDTGVANSGDLTSPPVHIPESGNYLRFRYWYETETQQPDRDQRWVQISVDDGSFENLLQLHDDPMRKWLRSPAIDLAGYVGHTVRVRFHFDTLDDAYNDYRGWYVDDFEISSTPPPSCGDTHEPNDNPGQATTIAYGQSLDADICPGGDYDFYKFSGNQGDKVAVDIDAMSEGSLLDPYVYLIADDGTTVLAEHDDEITAQVRDSLLGRQLPYTGTYYIKVKAWDHPSAGSSDHSYTMHLMTDDNPPCSAEMTAPLSGSWLDPQTETVNVSAVDDESGINRVEFLWHDGDWENSDWVWLGADHDGRDGWNWSFDTAAQPEQEGGAFYAWAFDWLGNWTGAASWDLGIDRTPPSVSPDTHPMYGDAPFRDFHVTWWDSDDNLSGIADYDVQFRDGADSPWTDLVVHTTEVYTRFVGTDGHTYYFRARARDLADNLGAYSTAEVSHTVDVCPVLADGYEVDDTASSARWLIPDAPIQIHNFHTEGDQDWVRFHAAAGITYTLATTSTSSHADTVLYLYDQDGTTLIDYSDDYAGMWHLSRLDWRPSTSGFYFANVEHWDPWAFGCTTEYGLYLTGSESTAFSQVHLPLVLSER